MTAAIAGMTAFGWVTQHFTERISVVGIGVILLLTALLVFRYTEWGLRAERDRTPCP